MATELTYDHIMQHRRTGARHEYDVDKVQLYGVGVGLGFDPTDVRQLAFLRDENPSVLPSFASVAVFDVGFKLALGIDWSKLIHAAERLRLARPLPPAGAIVTDTRIDAVFDKPARNATLLVSKTSMHLADTGEYLGELEGTSLARDFRVAGAPEGRPDAPPAIPDRGPDLVVELPTSPQVALVYRMLGGRSLIHFDPEVAKAQGFARPIMHGLSTWGHACHAIVGNVLGYEPERLNAFGASFSAPVYPGETLVVRVWLDTDTVLFEAYAKERERRVLANGFAGFSK